MRSVFLDSYNDEPLLSQARTRMREEEFISLVRAFLSLLVVAEPEYLDYVQSKLLPHKLSFDRGPPASPARETPQATPDESPSRSHTIEDVQPSDALAAMGSWQSHPAGSAPRLTTPETADSRHLFAKYTTLEGRPSPHEQAASVDTEMLDRGEDTTVAPTASCSMCHSPTLPTSENASDTLTTAADSNEPANNIMSDVAETTPLPWSSASPSQASSNWSPSLPPNLTPHPTTTENLCDRDLFATYTTLEDTLPHNVVETASSHNNEGMQDYAKTLTPIHATPEPHATVHEGCDTTNLRRLRVHALRPGCYCQSCRAVCISGRGRSYDVEPGDMTSSLLETPLLLKPQAKAMKQARGTNKGFESALYGNEADGEPRLAMHRT